MSQRFFDPDSVIWRVNRELVLLLGGGRALLMQIAHPKVATGVAQHSRFREDPIGRLLPTMNAMWSIVFDENPEAQVSLERIKQIHRRVRGTVEEGSVLLAGTPYDAQDPDLLLWVHATLIDSAIMAYELFVSPLSVEEKRQYYDESKRLALLFGVPEAKIPPSLDIFNGYMKEMIASDTITVGSAARAVANDILYPRPLILKVGGPLSALITTGLLPLKLRREYGLTWNDRKQKVLELLGSLIRTILPIAPLTLRIAPHARSAQKKTVTVYDKTNLEWQKSRR